MTLVPESTLTGTEKETDPQTEDAGYKRRSLFHRLGHKARGNQDDAVPDQHEEHGSARAQVGQAGDPPIRRRSLLKRLPDRLRGRSQTSKATAARRMKSEQRAPTPTLVPVEVLHERERQRAASETRHGILECSRDSSNTRLNFARSFRANDGTVPPHTLRDAFQGVQSTHLSGLTANVDSDDERRSNGQPLLMPSLHDIVGTRPSSPMSDAESIDKQQLLEELSLKWILNLSLHFRDDRKQEKLFVTYAERSDHLKRVTISWDYSNVRPGSLEEDLQTLKFNRDKHMRVYESVRVSLPDITLFSTVTNLKLKTEDDDRLHIYVSEDVDEIIDYPSVTLVDHIKCRRYRESQVLIDSHLAGFVYKVQTEGTTCVKKDIPGPDLETFLYELNAMDMLRDEDSVVGFEGIVTDEEGKVVKGLLISYCARGSLVDIFCEPRNLPLSWTRRKKWAGQIIQGLSAIHENGFVQGDLTFGNIVVDDKDNAHIIDLNRRGCPIGWEPPELETLIRNKQKVGMMISTKTDLYQMGMVLYGLAKQTDEPDRQVRDEMLDELSIMHIPEWYKLMVRSCLSHRPADRKSASALLSMYSDGISQDISEPEEVGMGDSHPSQASRIATHNSTARDLSNETGRLHEFGSYYTQSDNDLMHQTHSQANERNAASLSEVSQSELEDFVTPSAEQHPAELVDICLSDGESHVASRIGSTHPRSPSPAAGKGDDASVPDMNNEGHSMVEIGVGHSVAGSIPDRPHQFQHQDSGLGPEMAREETYPFSQPVHQDSGLVDISPDMIGLDQHERFYQTERRVFNRNDTNLTTATSAARTAAQRARRPR